MVVVSPVLVAKRQFFKQCQAWTWYIPGTSKNTVPGQAKLRRVPGRNKKLVITKYSSIKIDDAPVLRVIVHPE